MTDVTTHTFWPLKKGIPTEKDLAHLAFNIQQDWKRLGAALGLKEKQLKAIEVNNPNDVYERAVAVLQKWKKKIGRKATYHKLAIALNDQLVQRPGLVKKFSTDNTDNNVWLLKKGTPTDQELQRLAEEIPEDWKRIGRAVGLKEKHLKIIEIDHADDVCERALATLYKWQEKQGQEATYEKLAQALDDELVQRRDLVEIFCCDIYPNSHDVPDSHDNNTYQDEEKGQLRERGHSTRLQSEPEEEPRKKTSNAEQQLAEIKTPEEAPSFQETLQTWKRRESARATKEKAPSLRLRQSKAKTATCPEGDLTLGEEIQHIKDTMDAAMHRMNSILEHAHEPSNTAVEFPVAFPKEEKVTKESESQKEIEELSDVESSMMAIEKENIDQAKQERHMEETSPSCEVSPDPFNVEWPWSSAVFTSSWWQWLVFSGDER